jgi:tetratricopeptide (TPR) repeat protein
MDAAYVPAWIAIAELHVLEALRYLRPAKEAGKLAVKAAEKALALNAQCCPAMAVRGWVRGLIGADLLAGLQDLDAALQMDAEYALTSVLRAGVLQALGRHTEAVEAARRAQQINAYAYNGQAVLPLNLLYSGQVEPALETAQKLGRLFPGLDSVQEAISIICSAHDRREEALAHAQRAAALSPHSASLQAQVAYALARLNRNAEATRIVENMSIYGPLEPVACMAPVHCAMGDAPGAVKKLQQAKEARDPHFFSMRDDPRLTELRGMRAFEALWDARA